MTLINGEIKNCKGIIKYDGGKWGYKSYRTYRKNKKTYCETCGNAKNLHIHHKDENSRNDATDNLITLCCKCHLKIHSKYTKKFGKTLKELAQENRCTPNVMKRRIIKKHYIPID